MRRMTTHTLLVTIAAAILASPLAAKGAFPERITLPDDFRPEGIAVGKGASFWVGSIPTGAIYRGDLRTGQGTIINPGGSGRAAIGVELGRHGRLWVAGGQTGRGFVYDARSGDLLATHTLTTASPTFVNDVVFTRKGAYFTDSNQAFIYRVRGGQVTQIPLTGDFAMAPGFNVNGIDATRNGKRLVIVQSNLGKVFTVNPGNGRTREIALDQPVVNGDGILLDHRTLYVVQNRDNKVAVIRLNRNLTAGRVVQHITDPDFDVPSTIDDFGKRIYAVNARFRPAGTPPEREYWLAQFRKVRGGR